MNSLQAAEYCGFNLSLTLLLDVGASPAVVAYVNAFRWANGRKRVVVEEMLSPACAGSAAIHANGSSWGAVGGECVGRGIRGMWIDVLGRELRAHEPPNAHVLPLEDDTSVSPLFYWWLRRAARAYGPFDTAAAAWKDNGHSRRLVGISLYSPRLNEIHYPSQFWRPYWAVKKAPCFLFCLPCSWGALYFRAQWEAFLRFYEHRAHPPFYSFASEAHQKGKLHNREVIGDPALGIPDSRASTWPRSWKRFMIDFMYGRGDVMLYPNAPKDPNAQRYATLSFSTTYMEKGAHSGTDGHSEANAEDSLRPASEYDKRKTVPLVTRAEAPEAVSALAAPPPYDQLPVVDLLHRRLTDLAVLQMIGRRYLTKAEAQTRATSAEFAALSRAWLAEYG